MSIDTNFIDFDLPDLLGFAESVQVELDQEEDPWEQAILLSQWEELVERMRRKGFCVLPNFFPLSS